MLARLLGRLGQSVLVLLVVSMVSFLVFRYIGDPTVSLLGEDASVAEREALLQELGFDQSVPVQYAGYLKQVLSGHFGISYRFRQPVTEVIASRVPATVELSLAAALFAVVGGIGLGVARVAHHHGGLAGWRVAAHLPHRHRPHLPVLR